MSLEKAEVDRFVDFLEKLGWRNADESISGYRTDEYGIILDELKRRISLVNNDIFKEFQDELVHKVIDDVVKKIGNSDPIDILDYLKHGVVTSVRVYGKERILKVKLFDYERPSVNSWLYVRELRLPGSDYRADTVLFVNGIPLVIIEAKKSIVPESEKEGFEQILRYMREAPKIFHFIQYGIVLGENIILLPTYPLYPNYGERIFFNNWRPPREHLEQEYSGLENILSLENFLFYLKFFVFYRTSERDNVRTKVIARYNQYYAARKIIERIINHLEGNDERNRGLIWQWQGSGKSYIIFFVAYWFLQKYYDKSSQVFIVVDRLDLKRQMNDFIKELHAPEFRPLFKKIDSIKELVDEILLIKEAEGKTNVQVRRAYLTTIHKFQTSIGSSEKITVDKALEELGTQLLEVLKLRDKKEYEHVSKILEKTNSKEEKQEILWRPGSIKNKYTLFLIDEAHRTQYGILAAMMHTVFPNAMYFAFTGTPVFKEEKNTFTEFAYPNKGELYLHVYFIGDSIKDGFTIPITIDMVKEGGLIQEGTRLSLCEEDIKELLEEKTRELLGEDPLEEITDMKKEIEEQYRALKKRLTQIKLFLENPKRLRLLARMIAKRIEEDTQDFKFKTMIVLASRKACVIFKKFLDEELTKRYGRDAEEWSEIVMTFSQNDPPIIKEYLTLLQEKYNGKPIDEIRKEITENFKKEKTNPRILIVTDMLITGFDAPILRVMYLDKPLRNHKLLQTIARVNRPHPGKVTGLVVDSVGLIREIIRTMMLYQALSQVQAEEIRKDLAEHAMKSLDSQAEELKILIAKIKQELRNLKTSSTDLSIDIELLKDRLSRGERVIDEIKSKIEILGMHIKDPNPEDPLSIEGIKLYNDLEKTIKLYDSLGPHIYKVQYKPDIEILGLIYRLLNRIVKPYKYSKEVLDKIEQDIIDKIHEKTSFEELKEVGKIELREELLIANLTRTLLEIKLEDKEVKETVGKKLVGELYFNLNLLFQQRPKDPVYKDLYNRLEDIRRQWITNKITSIEAITLLKELANTSIEYSRITKKLSLHERIMKAINMKLQAIGLQALASENRFIKTIKELEKRKKIVESDKTRLTQQLFLELVKQDPQHKHDRKQLKELSKKLVQEYIIPLFTEEEQKQ